LNFTIKNDSTTFVAKKLSGENYNFAIILILLEQKNSALFSFKTFPFS